MKVPEIIAIAALDEAGVIGADGGIPWHNPLDIKRFKDLTTGHTVLMGRATFDSLPSKFKPLPNRINVVATRDSSRAAPSEGLQFCGDPAQYLAACKAGEIEVPSGELWVIGGGQIYKAALPFCDRLELTLIQGRHKGDAFFPEYEADFEELQEIKHENFRFLSLQRRC